MRLHFKKTLDIKDDLFDPLPHNKIGAVSLRERPNVEVLVDLFDDATPAQIQAVITKAATSGMILIKQEAGTFVVKNESQP